MVKLPPATRSEATAGDLRHWTNGPGRSDRENRSAQPLDFRSRHESGAPVPHLRSPRGKRHDGLGAVGVERAEIHPVRDRGEDGGVRVRPAVGRTEGERGSRSQAHERACTTLAADRTLAGHGMGSATAARPILTKRSEKEYCGLGAGLRPELKVSLTPHTALRRRGACQVA